MIAQRDKHWVEKNTDFILVTHVKTPLYSFLDRVQSLQLFPIKLGTFSAWFEAKTVSELCKLERKKVQRDGSEM